MGKNISNLELYLRKTIKCVGNVKMYQTYKISKKIYSPCILCQNVTKARTPTTQGNKSRTRETDQKTGNSTRERGKRNFQGNGEEKNQNSGSATDLSNIQSEVGEEDKQLQERQKKKKKRN